METVTKIGKRKRETQLEKCLYNDVCIIMFVCIVCLRVDQVSVVYVLLTHLSTVLSVIINTVYRINLVT